MELLNIYPEHSKILFIGAYPPPLGGVSVHLKRLVGELESNGRKVHVFDPSKRYGSKAHMLLALIKLLFNGSYDIIHIHYFSFKRAFVLVPLRYIRGFKIYFTDHNQKLFTMSNAKRLFFSKFIRYVDCLVVVNNHILDEYIKSKVKLPKRILIKNAFIPPPLNEEASILKTYTRETNEFLETHHPLLAGNAFKIIFHNKIDLYGLDLCVQLTYKLKYLYPSVGFIFAIADHETNAAYINEIQKMIGQLNLTSNFHFMTGQKELWPLFKKINLFIRPTFTDGDAVSIREALSFNCSVIASDVVQRPKSTVTFKNRDFNDLYRQASSMLKSIS
jgi:glycosyltransferase involved in cell wall biosynthesis